MLLTLVAVSCSSENGNNGLASSTDTTVVSNPTVEFTTTSLITFSANISSSPALTDTTAPIASCAPVVQKISPEEAKQMMEQGNVIIVDVRREDEYQEGHIPGAILVPNESLLSEAPEKLPNQRATLLIYCRSGRRSAEAALKLLSLGYLSVYDFGGIIDWPYEITK